MAIQRANAKYTITIKDKSKAAFRSIKRGLKAVVRMLLNFKTTLLGVAGVAGLGLLIKRSLEATDVIGKTAAKLGIATDQLIALRYAAELTGVGANKLDMGIQRMTRRIAEAAHETGEAKAAIKELGLDAKVLARLPIDEQLLEIAGAMESVTRQSERVRLGFKLFDSEGVALINTLGDGREALKAMMDEARQLGITLSSDAVAGIEDVNDEVTRLMALFRGFRDQAVVAISPGMKEAVVMFREYLLEIAEGKGGVRDFARGIVKQVLYAFESIAIGTIEITRKVQAAMAVLSGKRKDSLDQIKDMIEMRDKLLQEAADSLPDQEKGFLQKLLPSAFKSREEALRMAGETNRRIMEMIKRMSKDNGAEQVDIIDSITAAVDRINTALESLGRTSEETGEKTAEDFAVVVDWASKVATRTGYIEPEIKKASNAARDFGRTFSSAFEDAAIKGENLRDVLRGLVQDVQRIILRRTISEPLGGLVESLIPKFSFGGGGTPNMGAQSVAAVYAGAFAGGGDFTVPGPGGTDSRLIALHGTPGEQISVRTPGQQAGGDVNVNVNVSTEGGVGTDGAGKPGELGRILGNLVATEIQRQKRPGGLLA